MQVLKAQFKRCQQFQTKHWPRLKCKQKGLAIHLEHLSRLKCPCRAMALMACLDKRTAAKNPTGAKDFWRSSFNPLQFDLTLQNAVKTFTKISSFKDDLTWLDIPRNDTRLEQGHAANDLLINQ